MGTGQLAQTRGHQFVAGIESSDMKTTTSFSQLKWITMPVIIAILVHIVTITRYITRIEGAVQSQKEHNAYIHAVIEQRAADREHRLRKLEEKCRERN